MTHKATVGVFGLGSIGLRHAGNLLSLGYDVIGFDPSPERQKLFLEKGGSCADKNALLEQSVAVVIASPSQYHRDDLKLCIDAGLHAFVEKPLAHKLDGLEDLDLDATTKGLIIGMAMNIRFNPAVHHLKTALSQGTIGKAVWGEYTLHSYLPDWRPQQDHRQGYAADPKTGGIIFDAIHGIDLMQYLLGKLTVAAALARQSGTVDIPSDDIADILCRHDSGLTSRLHMDYITKPKEHSCTIATDAGFAFVDITRRHYRFTDKNGAVADDVVYDDSSVNDDYTAELDQFMKAVLGKGGQYCPFKDGIAVTENAVMARKMAGLPHE